MTPARSSRITDAILLILSVAGLGQLLHVALGPSSFARGVINAGFGSGSPPALLAQYQRVDQLAHSLAHPSGGNVLVELGGLSINNADDRLLASTFYYRAVYGMWPRRFYITDEMTVINTGTQLLSAKRPTDPAWLASHDVRAVANLKLGPGSAPATSPIRP